jgi:hypothetical protein
MSTLTRSQASTPGLVAKLFVESFKLGPITQFYMAYRAAPYAFSGIAVVGAQQVIAAVDRGRSATITIAQITATMVKLGFEDTVAAITSACVRADRPDAVAKVSYEMMLLAELEAATLITKQMVERGDISDATVICKSMSEHGHDEFMEMIAKENLPEPLKVAKDHIDNAVAWVTGSGGEGGDNKDGAGKSEPEAQKKEADEEAKEAEADSEPGKPKGDEKSKDLEAQSAPAEMTAASIM